MKRIHFALLIFFAVVVLALWWQTPSMVAHFRPCPTDQGAFGDLYGFINALFSGMALLGIVAAIFLQQQELSLSTKELRNSANALRKQVELSADAARIQVLPGLIQTQKLLIKTYQIPGFEDFDQTHVTVNWLGLQITELQRQAVEFEQQHEKWIASQKERKLQQDGNAMGPYAIRVPGFDSKAATNRAVIPELHLLITYMTDQVYLYEKIGATKLDEPAE